MSICISLGFQVFMEFALLLFLDKINVMALQWKNNGVLSYCCWRSLALSISYVFFV